MLRRTSLFAIVSLALSISPAVRAQCTLQWDAGFGPGGADNSISRAAVFDSGDGPNLYVAGSFTKIAGVQMQTGFARFDGQTWYDMGAGINNTPLSMAVFNDGSGPALYVAGNFTMAGGNPVQGFARWDGHNWNAVPAGGFTGSCTTLYVSSAPTGTSRLYAGGDFTDAGGSGAHGVAVYDGNSWQSIAGASFVGSPSPRFVAFDDPATSGMDLFVSGTRQLAGGVQENGIFCYDGATLINRAPSGSSGQVTGLAEFNDGTGPALYVGGNFLVNFGGVGNGHLVKWDGQTWSAVGGSITNGGNQVVVQAIQVFDDGNGSALYVAGVFTQVGTVLANSIARWDGLGWSALGPGLTGASLPISKLIIYNDGAGDTLAAFGDFTLSGAQSLNRIAKWDGTAWHPIGRADGCDTSVRDMTVLDDGSGHPLLIAAGTFLNAGPVRGNRIAAWDGTKWNALGPGFDQQCRAVAVFDDGSGNGPRLCAGGAFTHLGNQGPQMPYAAMWTGSQWQALSNCPLVNIRDMIVFDDGGGPALYAVSEASGTAGYIAKWNGTQWSTVGGGLNGPAFALAVYDDGGGPALYAAGGFTNAGGVAAKRIAKWNGQTWSALAGGFPESAALVFALLPTVRNGQSVLLAGGGFNTVDTLSIANLAVWDGQSWSAFSADTIGSVVYAMAMHDDGTGEALYIGGNFGTISGITIRRVAKWTGQAWQSLAFGLGGSTVSAYSLQSFSYEGGSDLFVGGDFTVRWTRATTFAPDSCIARWHACLNPASVIESPPDQSPPSGVTINLAVEATGGDLSYRWRRNGVPLDNNAQQTGVTSHTLTLFNVDANDSGVYDVVVQNAAGSDTSDPAHVTVHPPCIADIVGTNGHVDVDDLLAVITHWGACPAPCPPQCLGDIVQTCSVNVDDLLAVITHWGPCP